MLSARFPARDHWKGSNRRSASVQRLANSGSPLSTHRRSRGFLSLGPLLVLKLANKLKELIGDRLAHQLRIHGTHAFTDELRGGSRQMCHFGLLNLRYDRITFGFDQRN